MLARLFRRPNSSVLAKMANLDGSRRNGAKHEIEVAARLLGTRSILPVSTQLVLAAAREVGISPDDLPDFLHLEQGSAELLLLGQEELERADIEAAVQRDSATWLEKRSDLEGQMTERLLVAAARVEQHRFASEVLRTHEYCCVFCGLAITQAGARASRTLVASHIKPWRDSAPAERLDVLNGLTACPTYDVAFDTGLLTVNGGLRIHVTAELAATARTDPATRAASASRCWPTAFSCQRQHRRPEPDTWPGIKSTFYQRGP